jgi:hypothetical protein
VAERKNVGRQKKDQKRTRRLSLPEIEKAVEKIRKSYDDYMVTYIKNRKDREAFERRYLEARAANVGLDRFVMDELKWILRLREEAEEEKQRQEAVERRRNNSGAKTPKKSSFADRVIAVLRSRIEKYAPVGLGEEEVYDVDQLYGALGEFERHYWPGIDKFYRKIYPSRYAGPRLILENQLFEMTEPAVDKLPNRLHPLAGLLGRFPRNYREIEWEVKQCILGASFFLHLLKDELEKLGDEELLEENEREEVEKAIRFVHTVIEDFRLTDLKETNKGIRR